MSKNYEHDIIILTHWEFTLLLRSVVFEYEHGKVKDLLLFLCVRYVGKYDYKNEELTINPLTNLQNTES